MLRKTLVVGDAPVCGGRVLPYEAVSSSRIHGHQVALIGGRTYCEGCHGVGVIAKTGGPRRARFISEQALEGDVVVCRCPTPQPLVSLLQGTDTYDDLQEAALASDLATLQSVLDRDHVAALKKMVDDSVEHPAEAQQMESICPNMTNKEFSTMVLALRDKASKPACAC